MSDWFVEEGAVERLVLPDGEWIEIKKSLSTADQDIIRDRMMEVEVSQGSGTNGNRATRRAGKGQQAPELKARYRPNAVAILEVAIVRWSFKDKEGKTIPVSTKTIGNLKPSLAFWIEDKVAELNPLAEELSVLTGISTSSEDAQ